MSEKFKAPRGTFDVLPEDAPVRRRIEEVSARVLETAGYRRIEVPIFEETDLFARGVDESTDIVQKQMFSFEDQGGRSLTLRPEATASVCRAYLEHGMQKLAQPVKLWTDGAFFRHERPQAGRYRQFTQIDAEAIGSDSPLVDAELILLANDILTELGVEDVRLRLGSLGTPSARAAYLDELRAYLRSREDELSDEVRARIDVNPLRAFDADLRLGAGGRSDRLGARGRERGRGRARARGGVRRRRGRSARVGARAGHGAAPLGNRRRPRPRRPRDQGPDEAGRPTRRPPGADPRPPRKGNPARHDLGQRAGDRSRQRD